MKFKTLMIIKAAVCLFFAPILLFLPGFLLTLMGSEYGSAASFTGRLYGASLVGNLLLSWLGRNAEDSIARRAIIWDLFVYDAIGLIVTLVIVLSGGLNWLGWGIVVVFLFLTLGFGYFLLPQKKAG